MKVYWVAGVFVALLALLALGLTLNPREVPSPLIGKPAPDFTLPLLAQPEKSFSQKEMLGRVWILNVWASWCAPCVAEMPALQRFADDQGPNGVQVVGIALDDPAAVRAFVARLGIRYPILLDVPGPTDAGARLGDSAGVLPFSVLVSADGHLLRSRTGPFEPGELADWTRP
jgi:thiol-disulfide isomerase/thioredoxin